MKIRYDPDADVLMLVLRNNPPVDAIEEPGGVIVSYGEDGEPVSVEFLNASARIDVAGRDQRHHPSWEILVLWRLWRWCLPTRRA